MSGWEVSERSPFLSVGSTRAHRFSSKCLNSYPIKDRFDVHFPVKIQIQRQRHRQRQIQVLKDPMYAILKIFFSRLRSFPRACVICVGSTGAGKSSTISLVGKPDFLIFIFSLIIMIMGRKVIVAILSRQLAMLLPFLIPRGQSPNTAR